MEHGNIKAVLRSLLLSYLLSGFLLLLLAFVLYRFRLKESQIGIGVNAIYLVSCLAGGYVMGKNMRVRRFFWGMALGFLYFLILLAVSMLMNRGLNGDLHQTLMVMGICLASGTVGGMIS